MTRGLFAALAILLALDRPAAAHTLDEYLQATMISLGTDRIHASMRLVPGIVAFPNIFKSIDTNSDGVLSEVEQRAYAERVLGDVSLILDGNRLEPELGSVAFSQIDLMEAGLGEIQIEFDATVPPGSAHRKLVFENHHQSQIAAYLANCLTPQDPGLRVLAQHRNQTQSTYELDYEDAGGRADGPMLGWWQGIRTSLGDLGGVSSMFRVGMQHIAEGTDHMLFLLALLLPAPLVASKSRWSGAASVRRSLLQILKVVTAFTIGHSITLALAASGVVSAPSRPIEVLIAVSILISAVHALRPLFPGREAIIAAFFGLIHGLAFAATLGQLGLGWWARVGSILGFNLGIEAMQLVVVAAVMPSLLLLSRTSAYGALRIGGALFAGLASAGWIAERLFGFPSAVDIVVDAAAHKAGWIAMSLFLISVVSWLRHNADRDARTLPAGRDVAALLALTSLLGLGAAPPSQAADGKTLRIAIGILAPNGGNPYRSFTIPVSLPQQAVFDTLTAVDARGNVIPCLAVSWTQETPARWLFKLRPDVKFSNGETLTPAAIAVSAQHMKTPVGQTETIGSTLYYVSGAEAIDDSTVRVILTESDALFPLHAAIWRIPAPAQWQTLKDDSYHLASGSGPFVATARTSNAVSLRANPTSWHRPQVDNLEFIQVPDETARTQALLSGAVDIAIALAPENTDVLLAQKLRVYSRSTTLVHFLAFFTTHGNPALKDARVRRALNLAVNREAIVTQVLKGSTKPASQLATPDAFGYNEALQPIPYNPAAAKALLTEAGFAKGLHLSMTISGGRGADLLYYQQVAADLAKIGVQLELRTETPARNNQMLFAGTWTTDMFVMFSRGLDPMTDYRHRSCLDLTAGRAPYHCDPALLPLLRDARAARDPVQRRELYRQVAAFEQQSPPGILLWQGYEFDGLRPSVKGYAHAQDTIALDRIALSAE